LGGGHDGKNEDFVFRLPVASKEEQEKFANFSEWKLKVDNAKLGAHYGPTVQELCTDPNQHPMKVQQETREKGESGHQSKAPGEFSGRSRQFCDGETPNSAPHGDRQPTAGLSSYQSKTKSIHIVNSARARKANPDLICFNPNENAAGIDDDFVRSLGRKTKEPRIVTSGGNAVLVQKVAKPEDFALVPGWREEKHSGGRKRQPWQTNSAQVPRSGIAMVISPRPSDPVPSQKISTCSKSQGEYKGAISEQSKKHARYHNQMQFRFADERTCARLHCGKVQSDSAKSTPRATFRRNTSNCSLNVATTLNMEGNCQELENHTRSRLKDEHHFSSLCQFTLQNNAAIRNEGDVIRKERGHNTSPEFLRQLEWQS